MKLKYSIEEILIFQGINLEKSFQKSLFYTPLYSENRIKSILKLIFYFFKNIISVLTSKKNENNTIEIPKNKHIFYINSKQQIQFWKKTINQLGKNKVHILIISDKTNKETIIEASNYCKTKGFPYSILDISTFFSPNKAKHTKAIILAFLKILLSKASLIDKYKLFHFYCNSIVYINTNYNVFSQIKPKSVLLLANEVNPHAHIFTQIIHKVGGKVINSMNGIKNRDHRNSNTNFDAWLIWSQNQYDLLTQFNKTPKEQLFITGHLHADNIHEFRKKGKVKLPFSTSNYRKTIAVFSQPYVKGYETNRDEFLKTVNDFFIKNPDYLGIIKCHPRETINDIAPFIDLSLPNIQIVNSSNNDKDLLYSIIMSSDYSLLMYSTVAIECLFFTKPAFSFCRKDVNDPLSISKNLVSRFANIDELQKLLVNNNKTTTNPEELIYEIGWVDGQNYKRALEAIKKLTHNNLEHIVN